MKNKNINVGIIGFGVVGKRRKESIDKCKNFKLIAISDINPKNKYDDSSVRFYKSYIDLIKLQSIKAVFICLPTKDAVIATKLAIIAGLSIFCEKPPARSYVELLSIKKILQKYKNSKLVYGFNHRYHSSVIEAKKIVSSKKYGKIINFRGVYGKSTIVGFEGGWRSSKINAGGGILIDQGIHILDLILNFSSDFDEIHSITSKKYWKYDVEDNAYILMKNKKNQIAMIHSSATEWRHKFRLEIGLEKALLELRGILTSSKSYGEEELIITPKIEYSKTGSLSNISKKYLEDNSWDIEVHKFEDTIISNKKVVDGSIDQALSVMKIIDKVYKS